LILSFFAIYAFHAAFLVLALSAGRARGLTLSGYESPGGAMWAVVATWFVVRISSRARLALVSAFLVLADVALLADLKTIVGSNPADRTPRTIRLSNRGSVPSGGAVIAVMLPCIDLKEAKIAR
jgi:hypothetical protein